VSTPEANWPKKGERCVLRVAGTDTVLACVVEEVREEALVLMPSLAPGVDVARASQAAAFVEWVTRRGRIVLPATIVSEEPRGRVPALVVQPAGDPDLIQRRGHVRALSALPIELDVRGGVVRGVLEDVSGGGLRARVDHALVLDAVVGIRVPVGEETIEAEGRVAQSYGGGRYGLEFAAIEESTRERLIRHVFEQLRIEARLA
jgi:hypothetical protein